MAPPRVLIVDEPEERLASHRGVIGDLAALTARTEYIIAEAERAIEANKKVRDAARAESTAHKQALVEEAEKIAEEASQWKPAGDRLRAILDEWKTIKGVDR